jgi:hypothetical protein
MELPPPGTRKLRATMPRKVGRPPHTTARRRCTRRSSSGWSARSRRARSAFGTSSGLSGGEGRAPRRRSRRAPAARRRPRRRLPPRLRRNREQAHPRSFERSPYSDAGLEELVDLRRAGGRRGCASCALARPSLNARPWRPGSTTGRSARSCPRRGDRPDAEAGRGAAPTPVPTAAAPSQVAARSTPRPVAARRRHAGTSVKRAYPGARRLPTQEVDSPHSTFYPGKECK